MLRLPLCLATLELEEGVFHALVFAGCSGELALQIKASSADLAQRRFSRRVLAVQSLVFPFSSPTCRLCRSQCSCHFCKLLLVTLQLQVTRAIAQPQLRGRFTGSRVAPASESSRRVTAAGAPADLPLYRVEAQPAGAGASGPAVLEEAFFTCRIDAGWSFEVSDAGDVLLTRE